MAPKVRVLTVSQMEKYHNPKMLLRPINRVVVEQYAQHIKDGVRLPNIICATVRTEGGGVTEFMVDGNHIYRACALANKAWSCEFIEYDSIPAALCDQLKRNATHGLRITNAQRDARIKELIEKYNMSVRQVAEATGVSAASVSRINRDKQSTVRTGRAPAAAPRGAVVPHALPGRAFVRAVENIHLTLDKPEARAEVLAEIYNTNRSPQEIQAFVQRLREVADALAALVRQPSATPRRAARSRSEQMVLPAA